MAVTPANLPALGIVVGVQAGFVAALWLRQLWVAPPVVPSGPAAQASLLL